MEVEIFQGSILEVEAEAIVNAANSQGWMGGGVAGVIKRVAGPEVENEAVAQAPIPIGSAVLTSGGRTKFKGIIHAPTMEQPAMRIPAENVSKATEAALKLADEKGFISIALPGMGTGVGGVSKDEAARRMVEAIKDTPTRRLKRVILVDIDQEMVEAWQRVSNARE